ncbi:MAG: hypothetical protein ABI852_06540 [Gemmatimonadaceae bacterium]
MPLFEISDSVRSSLPEQARAFDFLQGAWTIHHRRLRSRLVGDTQWLEFETPFVLEQLLGGLGNIDQCQSLPPSAFFEGVSFRIFDLEAKQWKIYWVDSYTGKLCPPVVGTFDGDRGTFFGADQHLGTPVRVRFQWDKSDPNQPTWQQAFSVDDGASWETNWQMNFHRSHT